MSESHPCLIACDLGLYAHILPSLPAHRSPANKPLPNTGAAAEASKPEEQKAGETAVLGDVKA